MRHMVAGSRLLPPGGGPGTELKRLLMEMGLTPAAGCDCEARAEQMDRWGVAGCAANRGTIEGWLREEAGRAAWSAKAGAAVAVIKAGVFLNPADPAAGLLREALRRAQESGR